MEALLIYLLKVSGILTIFYLAYQLFLKRETFFIINRQFLVIGIIAAISIPFITLTNYIEIAPIPFNQLDSRVTEQSIVSSTQQLDWWGIFIVIYTLGFAILGIRLIIQLISLLKMVKSNKVQKHGRFYHVETNKNIAPFSFFNHIFYNPSLYSKSELSSIIKHEMAHSSQWHSIDVILSHLITICTWMNPFSWLYQNNIKQNLEFLADASATKQVPSIKNYQYTLLKVSGNQICTPIVNNFYNSLIKKRIVMLNKSKSNKKNILKIGLILPALAIFLVSFNTKDVYLPINNTLNINEANIVQSKIIEITIDRNTTDKELKSIKKDLAKKGVDFSYTVVHNPKNEIIDISIDFTTKKDNSKKMKSSANFNNGDDPIDPIHIIYDEESNSISMGNTGLMKVHEDEDVQLDIHGDSDKMIWVHADKDGDKHKTIKIIEKNGKETILVNGKEVSREELDEIQKEDGIHEKHIKIKKIKGGSEGKVIIIKESDNESDMDIDIISEEGDGIFFVGTDGDEKPIFIIDGKESTEENMKKLAPSDIESINVIKGEKALEEYGEKGKNGVIQITTKKNKD